MTLEELIRTIIPARGRKLEWKLKFLAAFNEMIRTIIPARGRKLARHSYSVVKERLIRTIIPVRGRKLADEIDKSKNSQCDKNHNPHKGTETRLFLAGLQSIAAR